MACACAERREAIRRGVSAALGRKPDAGKQLKAAAAFVARSAVTDIIRATSLRGKKHGDERR